MSVISDAAFKRLVSLSNESGMFNLEMDTQHVDKMIENVFLRVKENSGPDDLSILFETAYKKYEDLSRKDKKQLDTIKTKVIKVAAELKEKYDLKIKQLKKNGQHAKADILSRRDENISAFIEHMDKLSFALHAEKMARAEPKLESGEKKHKAKPTEEAVKEVVIHARKIGEEEVQRKDVKLESDKVFRNTYCTYPGAPETDVEAEAILNEIANDGHKKAFLLVPHEDNFILHDLKDGEINSRMLRVKGNGEIILYSSINPSGEMEKFNNFYEMKKSLSLGKFAPEVIELIKKEKMIMETYDDVEIEPGVEPLVTAFSHLNKDLMQKLVDNEAEIDVFTISACFAAANKMEGQLYDSDIENLDECFKILFKHAVNKLSLNNNVEAQDMLESVIASEKVEAIDKEFTESLILKIIEKCPEINEYGGNLLCKAIANDNTDLAKFLFDKGASLSVKDVNGNTSLHLAVTNGNKEWVEFVITKLMNNKENLADILNVKNLLGETPLHLAVKNDQLGCAKVILDRCPELSNISEYRDLITELHKERQKFIEEAAKLYKDSFSNICNKLENNIKAAQKYVKLDLAFDEQLNFIINEAKRNIENPDYTKTKLLIDFQTLYLHHTLLLQHQLVEAICMSKKLNRWVYFKPMLKELQLSYENNQKKIVSGQCQNSLILLENFLEKENLKIFEEVKGLIRIINYKFPKHLLTGGVSRDNLALQEGVCYGAVLELAAKKLHDELVEKGETSSIYPSAKSRFLQAAYEMSTHFPASLNDIDRSFQQRLGINIEPAKTISEQSATNFIKKIDTLIPQLQTEISPHFSLHMASEAGGHAIYCKLSPPYEIQDINYPELAILKTEDLQQFKTYLLFYFLAMAPGAHQTIVDLRQISKSEFDLKQLKIEETPKYDFTVEELLGFFEMTDKQKKNYISERKKISGEKNNLKRDLKLETLDNFLLMPANEREPLQKKLDEYLENKRLNSSDKEIIRESIKTIFMA